MKSDKLPKSDKLYIGIDQSVVCTSIALLQNGELSLQRVKSDLRGPKLLELLYQNIYSTIIANPVAGIAIEGYAYGAKGAYFNLGEIGGVIRLAVQQHKLPLIQVPPTHLKKYITGKGTSPKDIMIKEIYKKYEIDTNDNNDADAISLAILAREYYETEFHIVKTYRSEIHKNCEQIIGEHPLRMNPKDYFKDIRNDEMIADYEKRMKKANKI